MCVVQPGLLRGCAPAPSFLPHSFNHRRSFPPSVGGLQTHQVHVYSVMSFSAGVPLGTEAGHFRCLHYFLWTLRSRPLLPTSGCPATLRWFMSGSAAWPQVLPVAGSGLSVDGPRGAL